MALLFFNFHHLLNEFRVIQARATLVQIQREQNQKLKRVLRKMAKSIIEAKNILTASVDKAELKLSNIKMVKPPDEESKLFLIDSSEFIYLILFPAEDYNETECFDIWQVTKKHVV